MVRRERCAMAHRAPLAVATVVAGLAVLAGLAGCSAPGGGEPAGPAAPSPSRTVTTLEPLPPAAGGPPEDRLVADLRQSSRDVAGNRFQVWIGNGLAADLRPRAITYLDPRFRRPLPAGRLRPNPAGSERGYPLPLARPDCAARRGAGRVRVDAGGRTRTLPVADEAEVVARHVASRCLELAASRVARLSFADEVRADPSTDPPTATLLLRIEPTGRPGALRVRDVTGTPVLTAAPGEAWAPRRRVPGTGAAVTIPLRAVPARCDAHAFQESAGATTFRVRLAVGARVGDVLLPMDPAGARAALDYATRACGR